MTSLPQTTEKRLGLVIDLDTCVGCHACAVNCKEWNTGAWRLAAGRHRRLWRRPVSGTWLNRIHTFEVTPENAPAQIVHFPKSCLHCDDAPCVTVCPTGASHKRSEDGIVLVTEDLCIGCGLCAWACPYGAREMDPVENVMKKCTLCVDRIYSDTLPEEDRIPPACAPAPRMRAAFRRFQRSSVGCLAAGRRARRHRPDAGDGTRPVNKYLPPRPKTRPPGSVRGIAGNRPEGRRLPGLARRRARQTRIIPCILPSPSSSSPSRRAPGFGMIFLLGLGFPVDASAGWVFLVGVVGGGLAVAGLLASTFHLGHPERAWRALSQWRSSWLSREGIAAIATLILFGIYVLIWMVTGVAAPGAWACFRRLARRNGVHHLDDLRPAQDRAAMAQPLTPVVYCGFALGSGWLLASAFGTHRGTELWGICWSGLPGAQSGCGGLGPAGTRLADAGSTPETATGLGFIGKVRLLEKPTYRRELPDPRDGPPDRAQTCASRLRMVALVLGGSYRSSSSPSSA
jgi:Fe-S-cluster-containing dehydrogenase component